MVVWKKTRGKLKVLKISTNLFSMFFPQLDLVEAGKGNEHPDIRAILLSLTCDTDVVLN